MTIEDDVVAGAAMDDVRAAHIRDDVVAITSEKIVVSETALQPVVAAVPINGVVIRRSRDQDVVSGRAAKYDGLAARVVQVVAVGADRVRIVANDQRRDLVAVDGDPAMRVVATVDAEPRKLLALIDLQRERRGLKNIGWQVSHV